MARQFIFIDRFPADHMVTELTKYGWKPTASASGVHPFRWPDILITEKDPPKPPAPVDDHGKDRPGEFDTDLLGTFEKRRGRGGPDGLITLYVVPLLKCAGHMRLHSFSGENFETIYQGLCNVVLIHELAHWIVYDVPGRRTSQMQPTAERTLQNISFHEGLAQYLTHQFIGENGLLRAIFEWLNVRQSAPYQKFKELPRGRPDLALIGIELARKFRIQDFRFLKAMMDQCAQFPPDYEFLLSKTFTFYGHPMVNRTNDPAYEKWKKSEYLGGFISSGQSSNRFMHDHEAVLNLVDSGIL